MLTFEVNKEREQIEIHGDRDGFLRLVEILKSISEEKYSDHKHLMTSDWGGSELSSEKQGLQNELFHHVKIFLWDKNK